MQSAESEAKPAEVEGAKGVLAKLALELNFVEAGKDAGLLPVNSFVGELEDWVKGAGVPAEMKRAVGVARTWIDRLFDTTACFDAATVTNLGEWQAWMMAALPRWRNGQALAALPEKWTEGATATATNPAASPTATAPQAATFPPLSVVADERAESAAAAAAGAEQSEPELTLNLSTDQELLREFINESNEHLQNIENGVLVLEEQPADADTLNSIFRAFHTFKGGSGFLNLTPIKSLAHELESLLDAARQHKLTITSEIIDLILQGGDTLKTFVVQIDAQLNGKNAGDVIQVPTLDLIARVKVVLADPSAAASLPPAAPRAAAAAVAVASDKPKSTGAATNGASAAAGFVKVDTTKLDSLIDLVGELVISESMVVQDPDLLSLPSRHLARNLAQLRRITSELQRTAMSLRMVPIRATFQKMTRLVRDLAAAQNKQVQLNFSGDETELDRNIVEALGDPLVHMIRNSADHGIEMPEARVAKGKPAVGTIQLRAFHQGGNIVIQIADDGAGLNRERILAKAVEKGIVKPGESLPDKDIFGLIFAAGFSTAEKITDISGRGVGMDVVRRNIEKLRGKIDIESVAGKGTTFSIYLPLTLAIIDGMIVSVGGERYIIPTLSVRESFRPRAEMISTVHERAEMVNVRGKLCPLLRLYQYFNRPTGITDPTKAIVVVVESGQQMRCLLVDELLGKQEVVIKSLGESLKRNRALAGGAVLGDGRVGLILDVDTLVKLDPAPALAA